MNAASFAKRDRTHQTSRTRVCCTVLAAALILGCTSVSALAQQVNSWLGTGGGEWGDASQWSLSLLPGTGQSVLITNGGWKAVQISTATVENEPQALTVESITLASPTNSYNTLLLNYTGLGNPLAVKSFTVSSNTGVTMLGSALEVNGPNGVGMSVGGQFNQDALSLVTGNQMDIGWIGPGVYNLLSGTLAMSHVYVGGPFQGVFDQTGGSNAAGIVHMEAGGQYQLRDGDFNANAYFDGTFSANALFLQQGGRLYSGLAIWHGNYILENGVNYGGLLVPTTDGYSVSDGSAGVVQTGGTNFGAIDVGSFGQGSYTLSNGVCDVSNITIDPRGTMAQWNGAVSIKGRLLVTSGYTARNFMQAGVYTLGAGTLSSAALEVGGSFSQSGGTNMSRELTVNGPLGGLSLSGGFLASDNVTVNILWDGGFQQSAGVQVITNLLSIVDASNGFQLNGGELMVSNILLYPGAKFVKGPGMLAQSGTFRMQAGNLYASAGSQSFGVLNLETGEYGQSNGTLYLTLTNTCVVRFQDSSSQPWSNNATLTIENWAGSTVGNGQQQVYFGHSAVGLTQPQLNQISFHNPPSLPAGTYTATILASGEVVPNAPPPTGAIPLHLAAQPDGSIHLTMYGDPGSTVFIQTSTNLHDWATWTNLTTANGFVGILDANAPKFRQQFYRALVAQ